MLLQNYHYHYASVLCEEPNLLFGLLLMMLHALLAAVIHF
jgi:hypothetical protein